jgi:hypothetical protein
MSHPPPHTSAHENDSTLETETVQTTNQMKTVIKNSAQALCLRLSLTPRFSEVEQPQRPPRSCFNSFPGYPTESEYIRPNPSNFLVAPSHAAVKKSEISNL